MNKFIRIKDNIIELSMIRRVYFVREFLYIEIEFPVSGKVSEISFKYNAISEPPKELDRILGELNG